MQSMLVDGFGFIEAIFLVYKHSSPIYDRRIRYPAGAQQ